MKKYFHVWLTSSTLSIQSNLAQRGGALMFIIGKFIRFGFYLLLIMLISDKVDQVSGYTLNQMITFFLIFNLFDLLGQLLFRGVYQFRPQIVSGEFDFSLVKPISPLFQSLTRNTDILDLPLLLIVIFYLINNALHQPVQNILLFSVMFICGFLIIASVHILVLALGVITTEVDHTIMIYRDISAMARFPTDIYAAPIQFLLTFIIPVTVAFTIPAKAFMGLIQLSTVFWAIVMSAIFFTLSLKFWRFALTKYTSASS